ncbi:MAG: hypothetical protein SGILL_009795 [Bacillariaceae sp.]
MSSAIDLTFSDDDSLPPSSGLSRKQPPSTSASTTLASKAITAPPATSVRKSVTPASKIAAARQPPKKKSKPTKAFTLIWVCTHGKGRRSSWRKKDLQIVGIYPSKAAAEEAKREVMSQHEQCGHGDILVGGCWDDEVDLVIRDAPLFM